MRAAAVDARWQPTINLETNPNFASGVAGWTPNGGANDPTISTTRAYVGTQSMVIDRGAGSSQYIARRLLSDLVQPGRTYYVSVRLWAPSSNTGLVGIRCGGNVDNVGDVDTSVRDQWVDVGRAITVTAAGTVALFAKSTESGSVWIDAVSITPGPTPYAYADGDTPGWQWTGTPDASTSIGWPVAAGWQPTINYQRDPFFAYGGGGYLTANWPNGSAALDTTIYGTRGQSLRIDTASDGVNGAISGSLATDPPLGYITGRVRVRFDPTDEIGVNRTLFRIGGTAVAAASLNTPILGDGQWHEYILTVPVTGTGNVVMYLYGSQLAGCSRWFDAVSLTPGPIPYAYADGDSPGWQWTGTPGDSPSIGWSTPA